MYYCSGVFLFLFHGSSPGFSVKSILSFQLYVVKTVENWGLGNTRR